MKKRLDICIATCDIVGPIRNGGIGTAYYNLAVALARGGHRVTVLYALGRYSETGTIEHWVREYRRKGITLVPLPAERIKGHSAIKMSYGVYRWLKDRTFDIVHVHEWRGLGFYTALAKRQGLCLQHTTICIGAHSPVLWHLEGMNELADAEALEVDFMERETVARADVLWSPSEYLIDWMRCQGWKLPDRIVCKPYILLDAEMAPARRPQPNPELVFFGRLESRKGLDLFCDALDRLVARGEAPRSVTFLGKASTVAGTPSVEYLKNRSKTWSFKWRIVSNLDRDGAMAFLREPGRLAVLPSRIDNLPYTALECLGCRIPFLAAATGGTPEMVHPRDRERVMFPLSAEALASKLSQAIANGVAPATPRTTPARVLDSWLSWHERLAPAKPAPPRAREGRTPLVSVCITHHNRPAFLAAALESIRRQDYTNFEVILVDDGSTTPAAMKYLASLQPEFKSKHWTLIRQGNRYLGAARNRAIAAARGEYLLLMDDDNLAQPHEISTFVRAAQRTGADVLTCLLDVFQSTKPVPNRPPIYVWPFLGGALGPGLLRNLFGDANAFFRRDVFTRIGGFTEDVGVGCEDWELFARAVLQGLRLEVVPETLVRYRQSTQGMLQSTSRHANEMRALRPYLGLLPSHLRPIVHLARRHSSSASAQSAAARLDHVERAVVFGSGDAGRLAIDLATKCGWDVPWIVDNNPAMWKSTAHGKPVRDPATLPHKSVDLVIVASLAGKPAISQQLEKMGLEPGRQFVHFLDPVRVGGLTMQVQL